MNITLPEDFRCFHGIITDGECICTDGWKTTGWMVGRGRCFVFIDFLYAEWIVALVLLVCRTGTFLVSVRHSKRWKDNIIRRVLVRCFFFNYWCVVLLKLNSFDDTWFGVSPFFTVSFMNGFALMEVDVLDRLSRFSMFLKSQIGHKSMIGSEKRQIEKGYHRAMLLTMLGYNLPLIPAMLVGEFYAISIAMQISSLCTLGSIYHTKKVISQIMVSLEEGLRENVTLGVHAQEINGRVRLLMRKAEGLLKSNFNLGLLFVSLRVLILIPNVVQFSCYAVPLSMSIQLFTHTYYSLISIIGRRKLESKSSIKTFRQSNVSNATAGIRWQASSVSSTSVLNNFARRQSIDESKSKNTSG